MSDESKTGEEKIERARHRIYHEKLIEEEKRRPGMDALAGQTVHELLYTSHILNTRMALHLAKHRLSDSGRDILMTLYLAPEYEFKMHELGKLLYVSRGNITFIIKNLERRDLIERLPAENDKRAYIIKITAAGEALIEELMPMLIREQAVVGALSEREKKELRRILEKIRKTVEQMP